MGEFLAFSPKFLEGEFSELPVYGVLGSSLPARKKFRKGSKKDVRALQIHREFIGLCENAGKQAQSVRCDKGKPVVRRGRKA